MYLFILVTVVCLMLLGAFALYRLYMNKRLNTVLNQQRIARVQPLLTKLTSGEKLSSAIIYPYAKNVETRLLTYSLLTKHEKGNLFPAEFNTVTKAAEAYLVNWLEFPTEFGACPDEIDYLNRFPVTTEQDELYYEVFKFKYNAPHWAAENAWIIGVVGPYYAESTAFEYPTAIFGRANSTVSTTTPEAEVAWVHENFVTKARR